MIRYNDLKFVVRSENLIDITRKLQAIESMAGGSVEYIMRGNLIIRSTFRVKQENDSEIRWLRIMDGDIDCDNKQRCTVSYKVRKRDMSEDEVAELIVENYDDAVELFDLLGFEKASYQEIKRTKIIVYYDGIKYIVKFDIWPGIENITFITVMLASAGDSNSLVAFAKRISLYKYRIANQKRTDVDSYYRMQFGRTAMDIPNVTFENIDEFQSEHKD